MKKKIALLMAVCMSFSLCSCKSQEAGSFEVKENLKQDSENQMQENASADEKTEEEPEVESKQPEIVETSEIQLVSMEKAYHSLYDWDEEEETLLARCEASALQLAENAQKSYPKMAKILEDSSTWIKESMETEFDNFVNFERDGVWTQTFSSTFDEQLRRADRGVISILADSYMDSRYIHDLRTLLGSNYNTETGEEINLSDVITDMSRIPEIVEKELTSHMWSGEFSNENSVKDYFANRPNGGISWTLDYNGVTFYFNPGDIADAVYGIQTALVSFAEYPELFHEKYVEVPEAYFVSLPVNSSFFADVDDDGKAEEWIVSGQYDEEQFFCSSFGIYSEECIYEEECITDGIYPYYIKTADERSLLYLFRDESEGMESQKSVTVFLLEKDRITRLKEENNFGESPEEYLMKALAAGIDLETACSGAEPSVSVSGKVVPLRVQYGDHWLEEWREEDQYALVRWQSLRLAEEDEREYTNLALALEELRLNAEQEAKDQMEVLLWSLDDPTFVGSPWSESKYYVVRADEQIMSTLEECIVNNGAVHPSYWAAGINLDPVTGKRLTLKDVLTDWQQIPGLLEEKLSAKYPDEYFGSLQEQLEAYSAGDYTWTMGYQGITFYFSPYEIAAFSAGTLTASIGFKEFPGLFNEKYISVPANGYASAIPLDIQLDFDLQNTGAMEDSLRIGYMYDEYQSYKALMVDLNESWFQEEINYFYDFMPYLVCTGRPGKQKYFLYVDCRTDNDYHMLTILDLNNGIVEYAGEMMDTEFTGEWVEGYETYGTYYTNVLNDISEFELYTRLEILGTAQGIETYKINSKTGLPQGQTGYFTIENAMELTSRIPLEVYVTKENTWEEIPAGTGFKIVRTDGETYAEMLMEDQREGRLDIDMSDWPRMVNDIPEDDCFEGIMYAG